MHTRWITNLDISKALKFRDRLELKSGNMCFICRPHVRGLESVNELEIMNLVGVYMEISNEELKPDPECIECKGTGVIILFTSSTSCKCLKKNIDSDDVLFDYDCGNWE